MVTSSSTTHTFNTDGGIHEIPLAHLPTTDPTAARVGSLWLCGKHHIAPDVESVLARHSIDRVVCLVEDVELRHRYDDYVEWLKAHHGTRAVWHPMHDLTYPDYDNVIDLVTHTSAHIRNGGSVVVHCAAGIGRAGTTAVAICMMLGMGHDDALKHVRMHRPMAGPEAGSQREFIDVLSRRLNR